MSQMFWTPYSLKFKRFVDYDIESGTHDMVDEPLFPHTTLGTTVKLVNMMNFPADWMIVPVCTFRPWYEILGDLTVRRNNGETVLFNSVAFQGITQDPEDPTAADISVWVPSPSMHERMTFADQVTPTSLLAKLKGVPPAIKLRDQVMGAEVTRAIACPSLVCIRGFLTPSGQVTRLIVEKQLLEQVSQFDQISQQRIDSVEVYSLAEDG